MVKGPHRLAEQATVFVLAHGLVRLDVYYEIIALRQIVLQEPKGLAEQTLDSVSNDGGADATRNGEPEAGMIEIVGQRIDDERAFAEQDAGTVNPAILAG